MQKDHGKNRKAIKMKRYTYRKRFINLARHRPRYGQRVEIINKETGFSKIVTVTSGSAMRLNRYKATHWRMAV